MYGIHCVYIYIYIGIGIEGAGFRNVGLVFQKKPGKI